MTIRPQTVVVAKRENTLMLVLKSRARDHQKKLTMMTVRRKIKNLSVRTRMIRMMTKKVITTTMMMMMMMMTMTTVPKYSTWAGSRKWYLTKG